MTTQFHLINIAYHISYHISYIISYHILGPEREVTTQFQLINIAYHIISYHIVGPEREVFFWLFVTKIKTCGLHHLHHFCIYKIQLFALWPSLKETLVRNYITFTSFPPLQQTSSASCTNSLWWTLQCLERPYFHFYGRYQNQVPKWSCVGIGLFEGGARRCLAFLLQGSTLHICYPGELFSIYQNTPFPLVLGWYMFHS